MANSSRAASQAKAIITRLVTRRGASSSADAKGTASFGYQDVGVGEKQSMVRDVFESVAPKYDLMNDLMSGGLHRVWKDQFVSDLSPSKGMQVLDVAGGTGDIAFRVVDKLKRENNFSKGTPPVMVCDVNEEMLEKGRERAKGRGYDPSEIAFFKCDAEELPLESNSIDAYLISFGMRNVTTPELALSEAHRVLRSGGRFMMLEFGKVENPILQNLYDFYSFRVVPELGERVGSDRKAYQYLVESIRRFADQSTFRTMMGDAGFANITSTDYSMGIVSCYSGFKE